MSNEEEPEHDPLRQLTVKQLIAIGVLEDGGTQGDAALAARVSRQTVNGWQNHHPAFKAELRRRLIAHDETLMAMRIRGNEIAMDALLTKVQAGEPWAIKAWATHVGLKPLTAEVIGSTDPEHYLTETADTNIEKCRAEESDLLLAANRPLHTPRRDLVQMAEAELAQFFDDLEAADAGLYDETDNTNPSPGSEE